MSPYTAPKCLRKGGVPDKASPCLSVSSGLCVWPPSHPSFSVRKAIKLQTPQALAAASALSAFAPISEKPGLASGGLMHSPPSLRSLGTAGQSPTHVL